VSKLYVLGGQQRKVGLKAPTPQDEWYLYQTALILEVDTETGSARTCVEYQTAREARPGEQPAAENGLPQGSGSAPAQRGGRDGQIPAQRVARSRGVRRCVGDQIR